MTYFSLFRLFETDDGFMSPKQHAKQQAQQLVTFLNFRGSCFEQIGAWPPTEAI